VHFFIRLPAKVFGEVNRYFQELQTDMKGYERAKVKQKPSENEFQKAFINDSV
jgi:hypothetical protein